MYTHPTSTSLCNYYCAAHFHSTTECTSFFFASHTECGNFNHGPATLWPLHTLRRHRSQRQMCDDVRCELCTQCMHLEALGLCSWWQASQAKAHQQFIVMAPTTPTTRHYSLELLLAQHTVRTPTICNTRWCHRHFWHVVHPMHWYTNCDGLDTSVYRGVYDMSIACSTLWTTL